jgi:hypothetical protein
MINSTQKKIIIIIGFIFLIIFLGFLLYLMFFKQMLDVPENQPIATTTTGTEGLPIANTGGNPNIVNTPEDTYTQKTTNITNQKLIASKIARGGLTKTDELNKTKSSDVILSSDGKNLQYYNNDDGKFYYIDSNLGYLQYLMLLCM